MLENDVALFQSLLCRHCAGSHLHFTALGSNTGPSVMFDDLVEALIRLMNVADVYDPVNLGNPGGVSSKS